MFKAVYTKNQAIQRVLKKPRLKQKHSDKNIEQVKLIILNCQLNTIIINE